MNTTTNVTPLPTSTFDFYKPINSLNCLEYNKAPKDGQFHFEFGDWEQNHLLEFLNHRYRQEEVEAVFFRIANWIKNQSQDDLDGYAMDGWTKFDKLSN